MALHPGEGAGQEQRVPGSWCLRFGVWGSAAIPWTLMSDGACAVVAWQSFGSAARCSVQQNMAGILAECLETRLCTEQESKGPI